MGAWGVTARESDSGLDLLAVIETKCLKPIDFKHFDVAAIMEFLKSHIIEKIRIANRGCSEKRMAYYIEVNFQDDYNDAVLLVSECLADYYQHGELVIDDYDAEIERKITQFIFTDSMLDELLEELHKMLDPKSGLYDVWSEDSDRQEWTLHMKMVCDCLTGLKGGGGHE